VTANLGIKLFSIETTIINAPKGGKHDKKPNNPYYSRNLKFVHE
jgi:hypothetical protein